MKEDNEIVNVGWNDNEDMNNEDIQDYHILYNEITD